MMYQTYQDFSNFVDPLRWVAKKQNNALDHYFDGFIPKSIQVIRALNEQISLMGFTHSRPEFNLQFIYDSDENEIKIEEHLATKTAFCNLLHFKKEGVVGEPKILLVTPMSGHFATLLKGTLKTLLKDHEVYITDWLNIREVPHVDGDFNFDSYVDHIIQFLGFIGEDTHLMAVCQPTVAALVATAILSEDRSAVTPASLILMAGPIDVRMNPTKVNHLATQKPISWFKNNLIENVPYQCLGKGRRVYPGVTQLTAFINMNLNRHQETFKKLYKLRVEGKDEEAQAIADFYEEYFAVMDLSENFYLETVEKIFQKTELPKGILECQGRIVNPRAIKKPFLLTIEGERDDICGIGQTLAAQDLCALLPAYRKSHHLQAGVGHYGVFNGKRWEKHIYPIVRNHIQSSL
jgi:polyhydroxyalkanoate depolymerase